MEVLTIDHLVLNFYNMYARLYIKCYSRMHGMIQIIWPQIDFLYSPQTQSTELEIKVIPHRYSKSHKTFHPRYIDTYYFTMYGRTPKIENIIQY